MNAAVILARAKAAGLTVSVAGDRLRLTAAARPADYLLHELAGAKPELMALLADDSQREMLAGSITTSRWPSAEIQSSSRKDRKR